MSKFNKYLLISSLFCIAVWSIVSFFQQEVTTEDEYHYTTFTRQDNVRITKGDEVVIGATVVSIDIAEGYYVGLQLPAEYLECEGGNAYKIRVKNEEKYFILSTETGMIYFYISREQFKDKLRDLGIYNTIKLDYSAFKSSWKTFSRRYRNEDWDDCIQAETP